MGKASLEMGLRVNDRGGGWGKRASLRRRMERVFQDREGRCKGLKWEVRTQEGQCDGMQWVTRSMFAIRLVNQEGAGSWKASRPVIRRFYFSQVEGGPLESSKPRVM